MELVEKIKRLFKNTPSDLEGVRELLSTRKLTEEELAELAIDFVESCLDEYLCEPVDFENLNSNYILGALTLLLEFGLDPNTIVDAENVMWSAIWIGATNIAASVLQLFFEHGGNPNHFLTDENETLFEFIDFKVSYDEYTHEHFHTVQCWLILMAYGACFQHNGKIPLTMIGENSVEIFKNFQLYDYEIEPPRQVSGEYGCWRMHIFNIETKEEVAVY